MKVGVDGTLLGAWVNCHHRKRILDVGTGSGLIALMLAQRNSEAHITAIEIEKNAFDQAKVNFNQSPWKNRLVLIHEDYRQWLSSEKFDLIVSNPPYFINSLKGDIESRNTARHADSLSLVSFLTQAEKHLAHNGSIAIIYPFENLKIIEETIKICSLSIKCLTLVKPNRKKPPRRVLVEITREVSLECLINEIVIHEENGDFTTQYKNMTKDFYLNF